MSTTPITPVHRTVDRVEITDGLWVWDYDLDLSRISFADTSMLNSEHFDGWFSLWSLEGRRKLMNGERMVTVHPFTRQPATDAVAERNR